MLIECALPADQQERALGAERVGDTGRRVRRARSGRHDRATRTPGHARVPVGGVRGNLLVPHVDDLDPLRLAAVVDVDDVTAAQGEDGVDSLVLQRFGDEVSAGNRLRWLIRVELR